MKTTSLILLCITSLCCWGETNQPARDYKMIDVQNGLTSKLLEIGTTSLIFSVEWPLDMAIPSGQLNLYVKFHVDSDWHGQFTMEIDPALGKAIFEIGYDTFPLYYCEPEKTKFAQKAFFHFAPTPPDDTGRLPSREEMEEELAKIQKEREERERKINEGVEARSEKIGVEGNPFWFYLAVLPLMFAVFYFLRRKLKTNN